MISISSMHLIYYQHSLCFHMVHFPKYHEPSTRTESEHVCLSGERRSLMTSAAPLSEPAPNRSSGTKTCSQALCSSHCKGNICNISLSFISTDVFTAAQHTQKHGNPTFQIAALCNEQRARFVEWVSCKSQLEKQTVSLTITIFILCMK